MKTKNYFRVLTVLFMVAVLSISSASCSKSDDSSSPMSGPEQAPHPTQFGTLGKRLKSIADYNSDFGDSIIYSYKENRLDSVVDSNTGYTLYFDESQESCSGKKKYHRDWKNFTSSLSYNNRGHVVHINSQQAVNDADSSMGGMYLTYDNEGRLQSIYNKSNSAEITQSWILTWENDTITQISRKGRDGVDKSVHITYFIYQAKNKNETRQYTPQLLNELTSIDEFFPLFYIGYMGKGPAYLPVKAVTMYERYEDSRKITGSSERLLSYHFNADGTVKSEWYRYSEYSIGITRWFEYE